MRPGLSLLLVAALAFPIGCTRAPVPVAEASDTRSDPATGAVAVGDLLYNLQGSLAAEPSADVDQGLFLGHIASVESLDSTPALVLDFITADMQPGVSVEQRQKSSWPRYFGWNRIRHSQRVPLASWAVISSTGHEVRATSLEAFAREVASEERSRKWCVALSDGKVAAVWPWTP